MTTVSGLSAGEVIAGRAGRYAVTGELGRGGFGVTWRARREGDGAEVVLKQLRLERVGDWKAVELFEREGKILQSLKHPNIPAYVDEFVLERDGQPAGLMLVQSFVPGETLQARMRDERRMEGARLVEMLRELLKVLVYLHEQAPPVIHRDINPKNIILRPDGTPALIDFGTVQAAISSGNSVASTAAGTFGYAPMEQFLGRATPQSDLYGLAMTVVACATGEQPEALPFVGPRLDVARALREHGVALSGPLIALLERMVDPDAARRPASARECLDALPREASAAPAPAAAPAPVVIARAPSEGSDDDGDEDDDGRSEVERWREARERLRRLEPAQLLTRAPQLNAKGWDGASVSLDGRRALLWRHKAVVCLSLETMQAQVVAASDNVIAGALSADGLLGALITTYKDRLLTLDWPPDGAATLRERQTGAFNYLPEPVRLAASTPHRLVALAGGEDERPRALILSLDSGKELQRVQRRARTALLFSPAGDTLCCIDRGTITLAGTDGQQLDLEADALAFSRDGARVALWAGERLRVGPARALGAGLEGLDAVALPEGLPPRANALVYSPSATRLLMQLADELGEEGQLWEVDLTTRQARQRESLTGAEFLSGEALAFDADERRRFGREDAFCDGEVLPGAFLVWGEREAEAWGAIVAAPRGQAGFVPVGVVSSEEMADALVGRLDADEPISKRGYLPLIESPARCREALRAGAPARLEPWQQDALEDVYTRQAFWEEQRDAKRLPKGASLDALIERSAGLTHLLPLVEQHARAAQAAPQREAPRFGAATPSREALDVAGWLRGLEALGALGEEEREAQHEAMIGALEAAREATLAARAERARPSAPIMEHAPGVGPSAEEYKRALARAEASIRSAGYKPMSAQEAAQAPVVRRETLPAAQPSTALERSGGGQVSKHNKKFFARPWMPELVASVIVLTLVGIGCGVAFALGGGVGELVAVVLIFGVSWPFWADRLNPETQARRKRKREGR